MEVPFDLSGNLKSQPIGVLENSKIQWIGERKLSASGLQKVINDLGVLSAEAQSLKRPLTTFDKFASSDDDQAIYLAWERDLQSSTIYGFLKIVRNRRLYLNDQSGQQFIVSPICVLDFFVHPAAQRKGYGLRLFTEMLAAEKTLNAMKCAFDKPSEPLLQFLQKNFGMEDPIWQSTNIAVFPGFFEGLKRNIDGDRSQQLSNSMSGPSTTPLSQQPKSMTHSVTTSSRNGIQPRKDSNIFNDGNSTVASAKTTVSQRQPPPPDTPQGRKFIRDYGHQQIW